MEFFSLSPNQNEISKEDIRSIKMVRDFITINKLYYSDFYNLTSSLSSFINNNTLTKDYLKNPFKAINEQFCWNNDIISKVKYLINIDFFCFPLVNGYIGINQFKFKEKDLQIILISRKSILRSGIKFFKRGVDEYGNTANYVETEQVFVYKNDNNILNIITYIQLRGSIPIFWSQSPDLTKHPKVRYNVNLD